MTLVHKNRSIYRLFFSTHTQSCLLGHRTFRNTDNQALHYLERVAVFGEILGQNVQHPDHLGEDEHAVSSLPQPGQQFVQQHQLPAALHQTLERRPEFQHKEPPERERRIKGSGQPPLAY